MILDINGKLYEMPKKNAVEILKFGKDKLEIGIYGVVKGTEYAKAILEKYDTEEQLMAEVRKYEAKGFTVLYKK